jgi:hypothetical protein
MKYARIINTYAVDVRIDSPEGCYTPNIVAEFVEVPDDVQDGWVVTDGNWSAPVVHTPSEQEIADAQAALLTQQTIELSASVRVERDNKLKETDWIVIKNLELNANIPGAWEVYRQALRDVPTQAGFPWTITWPDAP